MTGTVFDSQRLMESVADDAELASELLQAYLEDAPQRMSALRQGLEQESLDQVVRSAHSLKGMSGVIRAPGLVERALNMEMKARAEDRDGVAAALPGLGDCLEQVLGEIRTFLDTLA